MDRFYLFEPYNDFFSNDETFCQNDLIEGIIPILYEKKKPMGYSYWVNKQTNCKKKEKFLEIDYTNFFNSSDKQSNLENKKIYKNMKKNYLNKSNFKFLRTRQRSRVFKENVYNSTKYYRYFINKTQFLGIDLYDLTNKIVLHQNNNLYQDNFFKSYNYAKKEGVDDISNYKYAVDFKKKVGKSTKIKQFELDYDYIEKERLDDTDYYSEKEPWVDDFYNPNYKNEESEKYKEYMEPKKFYKRLLNSFIDEMKDFLCNLF